MLKTNPQSQKLKSRYFERSLRFPITFVFFLIYLTFWLQHTIYNYGFYSLSTTQWIILGSGYFSFLLLEFIESLIYPQKPYFLMAVLLTSIRVAIYLFLNIADPTGISSSLLGYIFYTLCFYIHPIFVLPVLLLVLFVFYQNIGQIQISRDFPVGYLYELFSFVVFYLFGVIIRFDDRTRQYNQKLIRQLEMYARNSISLGKQEERNRISRDLHDSLGHQLVAVNIQLQKAVAYREINANESLDSINKAQQATDEAMKELRQTIKNLRVVEEQSTFEDEMGILVERVRENGLNLTYNLTGSSDGFPELTLLTLKQIIQEALTNIEKHAQATQAAINIAFSRRKVVVEIKDNGVGFNLQNKQEDGHYGLLGMKERIEVIGGRLKIHSKPNAGTTLFVQLPKDIYG